MGKQISGIRQGCPLSPYLFIALMTVIFKDIHDEDTTKTAKQRIEGTDTDEVVYADDTICIAQTVPAMNRQLQAIETEGAKYGFRLNKNKCEYLAFGGAGPVRFADGNKVERKTEVEYLGCMLNIKGDPSKEIAHRITDSMLTLSRLHMFFRHGDLSLKNKMIVYNAVIRTKVIYGLESIALNKDACKKLDAFYLKGLRKMLKVPTTYLVENRKYTNEHVLKLANEKAKAKECKPIVHLSTYHRNRRV